METVAVCLMRRALLAQYSNSARDYAYMVHQLSERVAYPDRIQYLNLHKATEEARIHAEAARLEYERREILNGFHLCKPTCLSFMNPSAMVRLWHTGKKCAECEAVGLNYYLATDRCADATEKLFHMVGVEGLNSHPASTTE